MIALIVGSTKLSFTAICNCTFRKQIDGDFPTAVDLGLALLPTKSLDVHDCESNYFDLGKGCFDVFELARLNNGNDELHENAEIGLGNAELRTKRAFILIPQSTFRNPHSGQGHPGLGRNRRKTHPSHWGILLV